MMLTVRSLNTAVTMTVDTVPTEHPAGTTAGVWSWTVVGQDGWSAEQETDVPVLDVSLPPGSYTASAFLKDTAGQQIGAEAVAAFSVSEPDVTIQTAGTLNVAMGT